VPPLQRRLRSASLPGEVDLKTFGFGLEAFGLLVLRFPRAFTALLAVSLVACVASLPNLRFDGNILSVLETDGEAFQNYRRVQRDFRDFSRDLGIIVRADDLYTPEGIEKLRNLHLDLTLIDGVEGVFSLFSSSSIDPGSGAVIPAIPERIAPGTDVKSLIARAAKENMLVEQLARPDRNAALISIESPFSEAAGRPPDPAPVHALIEEIRELAPPGLQLDFVGYPLMRADAVEALISDQFLLTSVGIAMVFAIALITFRAVGPALICALPALTAIIWVLGGYGLSGTPINYLSTALPTIAMVIALVDTIMVYFSWLGYRQEGVANHDAIVSAILRAGPANSMNMVTTAISFASFALGGNAAMRQLAFLGSLAVVISFVVVLVVLTLALHFVGDRIRVEARKPFFAALGPMVARLSQTRTRGLTAASIVITLVFLPGHFLIGEQHLVTAQLPAASEAAKGERLASEIFGGVAPIYMILPVPKGHSWSDDGALTTLEKAENEFGHEIGDKRVFSLTQVRDAGLSGEKIADIFKDAPETLAGRFISEDRDEFLITGTVPYGMEPDAARAVAENAVSRLATQGIAGAKVTGYPILASTEIPKLVGSLRQSFVWAIVLGIAVIAAASRAPLVALATLLPNLVPLLFIETALWLAGEPMDVAHIIALTIAFGITVDNAIHFINLFLADVEAGMDDVAAMRSSLTEVTPALVAATLMFIGGSIGTLFSSMPSVFNLGFLIIIALATGLIANLTLLPALILTFRRLTPRGLRLA